jgi:hypothetical protein
MITRYENLPAVGKLADPLAKVENCGSAPAEHREVASMNQDVSVWYIEFAV